MIPSCRRPHRSNARSRRARAATIVAIALTLACKGGSGGDASGGEQVAEATTTGGTWNLDYTVEETGVYEITATPQSGGDATKSTQHYHYTCHGSARLAREEDSDDTYAGPATTQCSYGASGDFSSAFWREKMTGVGVPDTTTLEASLALDRESGRYSVHLPTPSFVVVQSHSGATCQGDPARRGCNWVAYTKTDSTGVNGDSPSLNDQPYDPKTTTIRGSTDRPDEAAAPGTTRHVSWTLTLGEPPKRDDKTVAVAIEGPACACLDGERVPGAPVTWVATASRAGGTFSAFRLTSAGPAPKVVESTAGANGARITIEPTRATGAVTLTAVYTLGGHETTATRDVEFCVMDSLQFPEDTHDFAFDKASPGVLVVPVRDVALYNGTDASAELTWSFEPIGSAETTKRDPERPVGGTVHERYVGLPQFPGSFGPKKVDASLQKGSCACARHGSFRAFFTPTAKNHPPAVAGVAPGERPAPNWYYYYSQVPEIFGVPDVYYAASRLSALDGRPTIAQFDEHDGRIYVTDRLWQTPCRAPVPRGGKPVVFTLNGAEGIDCVAQSTRHEAQHRADWAAWWSKGYSLVADRDMDGVPTDVERARAGCDPGSKASCDERPFTDVGDREINAYWVGWQWKAGQLDTRDWACGPKGKQWKDGSGCGEE